jgi:hypothetical protein
MGGLGYIVNLLLVSQSTLVSIPSKLWWWIKNKRSERDEALYVRATVRACRMVPTKTKRNKTGESEEPEGNEA